jgi:filamentous hemagglutinin
LIGVYTGNGLFKIKAKSFTLNKDYENAGDIELNLTNNFINNKKFVSGGNLTISALDFTNNGEIF